MIINLEGKGGRAIEGANVRGGKEEESTIGIERCRAEGDVVITVQISRALGRRFENRSGDGKAR